MDWALFAKAYAGGALIGLSATLLLLFNGRIAGVSGIIVGALQSDDGERGWSLSFVGGLLLSAVIWQTLAGPFSVAIRAQPPLLIIAGLLVGFGTRLGSGCTSGHGVCGLGRRSPRSLVATSVFILSGVATVALLRLAGVWI